MLRHIVIVAVSVLVLGCAEKAKDVAKVAAEPGIDTRSDCYTVVLFDKHPIKAPAEGVTPEQARFLGHWKQGAWNGEWCHDLLITEVKKGGEVRMVDMHAPYEPWGQPASAFQRTGQIGDDGKLRVRYGTESITYSVVDGQLYAERSGIHGDLVALLEQDGYVPVPPIRPVASAASAASASKTAATF